MCVRRTHITCSHTILSFFFILSLLSCAIISSKLKTNNNYWTISIGNAPATKSSNGEMYPKHGSQRSNLIRSIYGQRGGSHMQKIRWSTTTFELFWMNELRTYILTHAFQRTVYRLHTIRALNGFLFLLSKIMRRTAYASTSNKMEAFELKAVSIQHWLKYLILTPAHSRGQSRIEWCWVRTRQKYWYIRNEIMEIFFHIGTQCENCVLLFSPTFLLSALVTYQFHESSTN